MRRVADTDLLETLATAYGFSLSYRGLTNETVASPRKSLVTLLQALDVPLSDDPSEEELTEALDAWQREWATRPLPPVVVAREGEEKSFTVHVPEGAPANVWVTLEDGSTSPVYQDENWNPPTWKDGIEWGEASFHTRGDLPVGWHRIHVTSTSDRADIAQECTLVVTPRQLTTNLDLVQNPAWGMMAQLYSVRSEQSWGIGDFHDLGELAVVAARHGADYLLINPVHAAEPFPPSLVGSEMCIRDRISTTSLYRWSSKKSWPASTCGCSLSPTASAPPRRRRPCRPACALAS